MLDAVSDKAVFTGPRNNYTIVKAANGYTVIDNVGQDGTANVPLANGRLEFTDVVLTPSIAAAAQGMKPADLQLLIELYIAFFNRVPEAEGLVFWINRLVAGESVNKLADDFYTSAIAYPHLTGYSSTMPLADFVKIIYKNVLGRSETTAPPEADVNFWVSRINSGTDTKGTLIRSMLDSAHTFAGDATWGWTARLLDNKYTVGHYFAVQQGMNYLTPEVSIQKTMEIAAAITPDDTVAAIALIPVTPGTKPLDPTIPSAPEVIPDNTTGTPPTGLTASCTTQSTPAGLGTQTTRTNCLNFNTTLSQIIPGFYIGTPDKKLEPNNTATQCTVRVRQNGGVEIRSGTATRIVEPALQSGAPADAVWNTLSDTTTQAKGYNTQTYSVYNRVNGTFAKIYWSEFVKGRNVFAGRISTTEDVQEIGCLDIKPFDFGPPEERYGVVPDAAYQTCTVERDGADVLVNECTKFAQYTPNIVFGRYRGSTLAANPEECVVSVHQQFGIEIDIPVSPGSETMKSRNMVGLLRPDGTFSDQWTYLLNQTNPQQEAIGISNSRVQKEALFIWNPTLPGAAHAVTSITDSAPGTGEPQLCGDLSLISRY